MQKLLSGYIRGGLIAAAIIFAAGISACRKEFPALSKYDTDTAGLNYGGGKFKKRKVLLIGIDGAPGKLVESFHPTVMTGLLTKSVYTWGGLNDTVSTVAAGWTGLTTGMPYLSHQIGDSTLIPKSVQGSHADIKYYFSFIYYLKQDNLNTKVTAITQWDDLNNFLLNNADKVVDVSRTAGDKGVVDAAVTELTTASPDALIVDLSGPAQAGLQAGFSDNAIYRQAITDVDANVGKLLDALKARKDADKEDWLVIIQSTSGGYMKQMGGKSAMERNTFSIYYSPLITPGKFDGPKIFDYGIRFHGGDPGYVRAENYNDSYNPGTGDITIEAKVKFAKGLNGDYDYYYPPFLTKCRNVDSAVVGWSFYRSGNDVVFVVHDGTNALEITPTKAIVDGNFHAIAATITHTRDAGGGNTYTANVYVDGEGKGSGTITDGEPAIVSPSPLVIGYNPTVWYDDNVVDMYMSDVRIWNTTMPDDAIKKYAYVSDIDATHPYYKNLIGNWPGNDGSGNKLVDKSASHSDFTIVGPYSWDFVGAAITQSDDAPSIHDVVPSMMTWIGITLQGDDKPPGKNWLQVIGIN